MDNRKKPLWLAPILVLVCLLVLPAEVVSQCNVTMTMSYATFAPATINVTKTLSAAAACMTTAMNAYGCFPGAASFTTNMLNATRMGTANPFCNWSCACGVGSAPHVTINNSDGLPVELMDFAIEDEVAAVPAAESGEEAGP